MELFGKLSTGEPVHRIGLHSGDGRRLGASIITLGASVQAVSVLDKDGGVSDVALGFDTLDGYLGRNPCFGGTPGRYANRIANGTFSLEGRTHNVTKNWLTHTLHGGKCNFSNKVWSIAKGPWVDDEGASVVLALRSEAGEEGFPGELNATVTYRWTTSSSLEIEWSATTDRATVVNLTNHSYFNLKGVGKASDVLDHDVEINASTITEVNAEAIPSGNTPAVASTAFDFLAPHKVGERITQVPGGGYDHNYCVNIPADCESGVKRFVARVKEASSGRCMEVWATQPGVQFFTANNDVVEGIVGKSAVTYPKHGGLCLETQHFPDSPNHPSFPSTTLLPNKVYSESCSYRFSVC